MFFQEVSARDTGDAGGGDTGTRLNTASAMLQLYRRERGRSPARGPAAAVGSAWWTYSSFSSPS